jgi:hypothetical protein
METHHDQSLSCSICCESFNKTTHKDSSCVFCQGAICLECQKVYLTQSFKDPECMMCHRAFTREHLLKLLPKTFLEKDLKRHRGDVLFERERCLLPTTQANMAQNNMNPKKKRRMHFVRKCPGNGCNGFLGTDWTCSLCNTIVCDKCLEIKNDVVLHSCSQDDIETAKLIKSDSKPCPSCGVVIFKVSGCSQMWCTSCHSAFDWNTLIIEKGQIHNPHYFEYMADRAEGNQANFGGVEIAEQMNFVPLHHANACWKDLTNVVRGKLYRFLRGFSHIHHVDIPRLQRATNRDDPNMNEDIRRKYLANEIDETKFKMSLQRREKKREVKRELLLVMEMFAVCGHDVLRKSITTGHRKKSVEEGIAEGVVSELTNLQEYVNDRINTIESLYGISVPRLVDTGYDLAFIK